ncbi:hypothetical protein L2E82_40852 [Cichorium intybus]|uniref:Uncharacterized protein n=1 Tax=Cichorium intybus TaxID=13427 RepID=A0ACB9ANT9_CICIN|nr:hypothetical protein L2E82_40852 [Cichorium intybus]
MAASLALKRGTTGVAAVFNKLLNPIRSVSAIPSVQRCFNSGSSQMTAYDDGDRGVDVDRRSDTSVSRRRDNDLFSDLLDPFSPPRSLSQIFNMMDQFMGNPLMSTARGGGFGTRRGWDAKEDNESLSFRFDMPGIDKDNVKISVEQNTLVIRAEAEKETEDEEEPPRRYTSRIDLPLTAYKVDEIKAELKNGVLKIRVPKVKEEERKDVRQIQVE